MCSVKHAVREGVYGRILKKMTGNEFKLFQTKGI